MHFACACNEERYTKREVGTLEIAKSWQCMPVWSRLKFGPRRSIRATKHQNDSDSSPITNNIGERKSLIPCKWSQKIQQELKVVEPMDFNPQLFDLPKFWTWTMIQSTPKKQLAEAILAHENRFKRRWKTYSAASISLVVKKNWRYKLLIWWQIKKIPLPCITIWWSLLNGPHK